MGSLQHCLPVSLPSLHVIPPRKRPQWCCWRFLVWALCLWSCPVAPQGSFLLLQQGWLSHSHAWDSWSWEWVRAEGTEMSSPETTWATGNCLVPALCMECPSPSCFCWCISFWGLEHAWHTPGIAGGLSRCLQYDALGHCMHWSGTDEGEGKKSSLVSSQWKEEQEKWGWSEEGDKKGSPGSWSTLLRWANKVQIA